MVGVCFVTVKSLGANPQRAKPLSALVPKRASVHALGATEKFQAKQDG
jgi:hypothetical protein